ESPVYQGDSIRSRSARRRASRYRGNLVSTRIAPLRLEAFDQLPKHARRCVFWEVDPSTMRGGDHLADPEFEKEAWLSMVMLEWGSCGQLALRSRSRRPGRPTGDGVDRMDRDAENDTHDEHCFGYAFYA